MQIFHVANNETARVGKPVSLKLLHTGCCRKMAHFHCDFIQIILLCKTVNQQIVLFLSNSVCLNRLFCVFFSFVLPILRMHFAYVYISCLSICEFIVSVIRNLIVVPDSSNVFSLRCKTLRCHFSKVHLGLAFSSYNQRQ